MACKLQEILAIIGNLLFLSEYKVYVKACV